MKCKTSLWKIPEFKTFSDLKNPKKYLRRFKTASEVDMRKLTNPTHETWKRDNVICSFFIVYCNKKKFAFEELVSDNELDWIWRGAAQTGCQVLSKTVKWVCVIYPSRTKRKTWSSLRNNVTMTPSAGERPVLGF